MSKRLNVFLVLMLLTGASFFSSCASSILSVNGIGENLTKVDDKTFIYSQKNDIEVFLAYSDKASSQLIYDVVINNNSDHDIHVAPENFLLLTKGNETVPGKSVLALDPVRRKKQTEAERNRLIAERIVENQTYRYVSYTEGKRQVKNVRGWANKQSYTDKLEAFRRSIEDIELGMLKRSILRENERLVGKIFFELDGGKIDENDLCDNDTILISAVIDNVEHSFEYSANWQKR